MWNPSTRDCAINQACKIDKYLDIKNCSCEKLLIGKSVIQCEDEVLNITETSVGDKKKHAKKKLPSSQNFFINYTFVIINCCFVWLLYLWHKRLDKKEHSVSY